MVPGDRLLCIFIQNQLENDFQQWPLHITIVPWFRTDISTKLLIQRLNDNLSDLTSFEITIAGETSFGYKGRKQVNLIEMPSPLEQIERIMRDILHEANSWLVDETTKLKRQFLPHVTMQGSHRVHEGDRYLVETLYIVEQKGDYKAVVGPVAL